jgi:malto-oligosyltrehalose trehalohydrolase
MPFGAELAERGVRFAIWAPGATDARLHLDGHVLPMERATDGFFVRVEESARAGSRYAYSFDGRDLLVPDPASRFNPEDVHAPSEVVDPGAFEWTDEQWRGRPWREAVIYELHVGTFTAEGTYAAARARLDYLAELGVTAIELMPVADTPGTRNWGYDGVLPFAPEHGYGSPEDLKRFVQDAHARGLMVLLDVVYNHFGPEGNYLNLYASQFFTDRHHTPWGRGVNFDDDASEIVRRFFIHNALYWLEEYHFDGLRLDAVHAIADDSDPSFLDELAAQVRSRDFGRAVHLVLENDANGARYLRRGPDGEPRGYTAQWNDDFHHALHMLIAGDAAGYYKDYDPPAAHLLRALLEGFAYQGEHSPYRDARRGEPSAHLPPDAFVNFLQNHDQIGNRPDGKRLWMLIPHERMLAAELLLALLPTPIMLFMGDEFRAPNLFPFFCDFSGELGAAVEEGRRRETLALFGDAFPSPLPSPIAAETQRAAVLDWTATQREPHASTLARMRAWLGLRRSALFPRLPARAERGALLGERALEATWRLADGARLHVVANLDDVELRGWEAAGEPLACTSAPRPGSALPPWHVCWTLERG